MEFVQSQEVTRIINSYPDSAKEKLEQLRALIVETAKSTEAVQQLVETTKWGEPSYITKTGSTIRMDWKEKNPDHYCLYFICTSNLVNTFQIIFGDELHFEGNRAIVLDLNEEVPLVPLRRCIQLALTYKKVKDLPLLGA